MSQKATLKTTFDRTQVIQPFYTGAGVALSQDGRVLATCVGEDVLLTDMRSGQVLSRIEGDGEIVTSLSLTPSASHVIACSRSLSMRIYAIDAPSEDATVEATLLRTLKPHSAPVIVCAVDKTGTLLATGGADGVVKVWDIRGGYVTHTFHGHSGIISALLFFEVDPSTHPETSKNTAGRKRKANRNEVEQAEENNTAGFRLASGGEDGKVRVWNLLKRSTVAILDSHVSVVRGLDYCPEENALVSASRDQTAIIWDTQTWKTRNTIPVLEAVESCGFLQGGSVIFTAGERGCVRLWSATKGEEVTAEQDEGTETEAILSVLSSDQLPFLLSVHADQTLVMHSLSPLTEDGLKLPIPPLPILRRISGTHDEVIDLALIGQHGKYLALATNTEEVRIVSLESRQDTESSNDSFTGAYFGSDIAQLKAHEDIVITIDVDPSGHWLATGSKDNTARIWRMDPENNSYGCHAVFTGHAGALGGIAMSHSDPETDDPLSRPPRWLVTGSQDRTVKRWEVPPYVPGRTNTPGKAKYTRKAHDKEINALDASYHPRDPVFASASQDKTVKIWDVESGETLGVLRGHSRGVWAVRFSPLDPSISIQGAQHQGTAKGKGWVATGGGDRTVRIWSLVDYSCVATLEGHSNSVLKVVWLPSPSMAVDSSANNDDEMDVDGGSAKPQKSTDKRTLVASAAADGLVKVWDLSIGECATTLDGHEDRVWGLAVIDPAKNAGTYSEYNPLFSTRTLISGGADAVLNFWSDTSASTASAAAEREERIIEEDQELSNLRYAGKLREAVGLAIAMERPSTLLSLFTEVLQKSAEAHNPHEDGETMDVDVSSTTVSHHQRRRVRKIGTDTDNETLNAIVNALSDSQIFALLLWLRDWNASAKNSGTAQRVLYAIVRNVPAERMAKLHGGTVTDGGPEGKRFRKGKAELKDVVAALAAYTERHIQRVDELQEESYLVDFTLGEMDDVGGG
ncbi:platelet-activating factor acetylhydrolase IB alpha subunit [Eremomyces bilateralis CBS 781.70]|uniref:Platelet-activating factor acetylhydrolase IB alpha subunit n=1 Tax=Eremomyces bilateralis CBS 781.70 TaxID=1392243 RepID=A0A6G1GC23_9PEZI|nr:platelet-activating factor acetylhydrolase IB alpha subunit [Eremomyces bilateralis CBS 781.70]KAF1815486.1 platelet-activating factor acetylhydrolase IB alpha subunit [Eremomyces bilateralis CBS 781.70]